jgi:general secretion pathway protein H
MKRSRGFTLIELLVVLLVMGLAAGLIGVIAQPDERTRLKSEAERLAGLLDLAATESRLTGQAFAWSAEGANYSFSRWSEAAGWSGAGEALRARSLPPGMAISALRIEFNPYVSVPFEVQMSLGEARYAVVGSPVGEVRIHDLR